MKWKARPKINPRHGTVRFRFKFCWTPTKTDDDMVVWFERVLLTEVYDQPKQNWKITERYSSSNSLWQNYEGKV